MTKVIVHGSNLKKRHIVYAYTQIKASNIRYTKIMNGIFPIMTGIFPIMNSRFSHLHIMMLVTYKHMILLHSTSERHQYDVNMTSMFHKHLYKTRINYVHSILITSTRPLQQSSCYHYKNSNLQHHIYQQQSLLQQQPHIPCEEGR